ncbi:MAG: DUF86 domain-containing protein [Anaerolineaceae bacterium]|nr:DUF86 domain-containing protein [Anaerolineaceae bacterium]
MNNKDQQIIRKILNYCDEIAKTHVFFNHDSVLFKEQEKGFVYRNAVTMPILQIGELAKGLSKDFCEQYNKIPWRDVMGMRDIFAHHYGNIDYDIVWETATKEIPELRNYLQNIVTAQSTGRRT